MERDVLTAIRAASELLADDVGFLTAHWKETFSAAVLFFVGVLGAAVVVKDDDSLLVRANEWIVRQLLRAFGKGSSARIAAVIFALNGCAIFVYMMSGGLVVLPWVFALLTGLNVGLSTMRMRSEALASRFAEFAEEYPEELVKLCGVLVLLLELPCFWVSIGMGMRLGFDMTRSFTWGQFERLSQQRVEAYLAVVLPLLAISAVCEAIAIKGASSAQPPEDGEE